MSHAPEAELTCSFMIDMTSHPSMIRNVMVGGHIHHGKTSLLDMLVFETHQLTFDTDQPVSSDIHLRCICLLPLSIKLIV